jgi:hypothetical protein
MWEEGVRAEAGRLGMVAHPCNPSYSGGRSGGSRFEASTGKKSVKSYLNKKKKPKKKLGMIVVFLSSQL